MTREGQGARPLGRRRGSPRHRRGHRAGLQRAGHPLNEVAILVRASFQMREFEDRFITLGLPYRVVGGPRFMSAPEIRDALAYLKVTMSARQRSGA
jgi:superfamily I DNA/RNA helicase